MCGSMADVQSAAADIRRGIKKEEEEEERTNHSMKIYMVSLFHRATINNNNNLICIAPECQRLQRRFRCDERTVQQVGIQQLIAV